MRGDEVSAMSRGATEGFKKLEPGVALTFQVPMEQPLRRQVCQAINGSAYFAFGRGNYFMKTDGCLVTVTRRA